MACQTKHIGQNMKQLGSTAPECVALCWRGEMAAYQPTVSYYF